VRPATLTGAAVATVASDLRPLPERLGNALAGRARRATAQQRNFRPGAPFGSQNRASQARKTVSFQLQLNRLTATGAAPKVFRGKNSL